MHVIAITTVILGVVVAFAAVAAAGRRTQVLVPVRIKRDRR